MRIITISREFGSGGRELGKRLAEELEIPCYDHQIIEMIAEKTQTDKNYVSHVSEKDIRAIYPSTIGRRFVIPDFSENQAIQIQAEQRRLIEELALQGDCVFVGRCADIILKEYNPFNIFVYADQGSKTARCLARDEGNSLTAADVQRKMKSIDQGRASYRARFSDRRWGRKESYHLCVNTSGKEIKSLIPAIAAYAKCWFESN